MRHRYRKMTPDDLSAELNSVGLNANSFAKLSGARRDRVLDWIAGKQDIPHYVPILLSTLTIEGAAVKAQETNEIYLIPEHQSV